MKLQMWKRIRPELFAQLPAPPSKAVPVRDIPASTIRKWVKEDEADAASVKVRTPKTFLQEQGVVA